MLRIYLAGGTPLYGHVAAIATYFNELLWNYKFIITKIYFH